MPFNVNHWRSASPSIDLPDAFPHGGGVETAAQAWQCDVSEILDLSTGLHPAGEPAWLGQWMQEHASLVGHYPDIHGEPACSALAEEFHVKPENILITAGAQASIEVVFQAIRWQSMAIQIPCYNEPIRCAKRAGCDVCAFEAGQSIPAADMLWLTSPCNPFGIANDFPQQLSGVLDESYMPFAQRRSLGLMPDVIRIGSLTKTFCIPGLRLGYVIADTVTVRQLSEWLPPWPASTLVLHLLAELLPEANLRDEQIITCRNRLAALLEAADWKVQASEASFLMARPHGAMPDFSLHRMLVRQFPEWPQLHGWVRFGFPGNEAAWRQLEEALLTKPSRPT